ncbi:RpiB/LacA/LacB family sugar-phosphate isomerase [Candidatus Kaiserbacteria bacterium]|nr:MAG: RpiB/LacA/LacB family sugar-phosphate isomerase [Candidatus Kaiserbacteria bacterium]
MKIYIATDHAGFPLKEHILPFVREELGYEVVDCGDLTLNPTDDYPLFMKEAARAVSENPEGAKAIIFGWSGQGEAIVANRFPHIRAVVYYGGQPEIIRLSREHNDANVLSFGAHFVSVEDAKEAVALWLSTPFTHDDRHVRRIAQIDN